MRLPREDKPLILNAIKLAARRLGMPGMADLISVHAASIPKKQRRLAQSFFPTLDIEIDPRRWKDLSKAVKRAVIAHEVTHLVHRMLRPHAPSHGRMFFHLYRRTGFAGQEWKWRQTGDITTGGYMRLLRRAMNGR